MRHRNGKGLTFAIDAKIKTFVEEWRRTKEYYPSLREISENFDPPRSVGLVHHHLRRLAAAGQLSPEAELIYGPKKKKDTGPVLVFDEFIESALEILKIKHGYYPTLKQLGAYCKPPQLDKVVQSSLKRLIDAGRLSKEACRIYSTEITEQNIKQENVNEKTGKGRKARK